jgi:hypothetical protein
MDSVTLEDLIIDINSQSKFLARRSHVFALLA